MNNESDFAYDDDEAVKFIKNSLPQELKHKFSDDDINYIIDLIYEFYDSKGYLNGSDDSDVEIDEDELVRFVVTNAQKDGFGKYQEEDVVHVVQGELDYCESIGLFE